MEGGHLLRGEAPRLAMPAQFGFQLDVTVIQRIEHPTQDIEQLFIAGLGRDLWSVDLVLLIPVDVPQFEEWVPVVERLPQRFEILLRVAGHRPLAIVARDGGRCQASHLRTVGQRYDGGRCQAVLLLIVGQHSYEKLRAGELDSVDQQSASTDQAHNPRRALRRLQAARSAPKQAQAN